MFKLILTLLCACALAAASSIKSTEKPYYSLEEADKHFELFIDNFNREYLSEEEKNMRFEIFKTNLDNINRKNMNPHEHATFDITLFADLTTEEFLKTYTGLDTSLHVPGTHVNVSGPVTIDVPDKFDWREKNAVTRVKNQGNCGSCWAFSSTGAIEGAYAIKHQKLVEVSEQQLVDCDKTDSGCGGGLMSQALNYVKSNGGIESEKSYPYKAQNGQCKFDAKQVVVKLAKVRTYDLKDEEALRQTLITDGPISIGIDATDVMGYRGGILKQCANHGLDHGVLLVGYGVENDIPYWIIKNSWGTSFGEKGYFRVKRGINACGMMNDSAAGAVAA